MIGRGPTKRELLSQLDEAKNQLLRDAEMMAAGRAAVEQLKREVRDLRARPSVEALRTRALVAEDLLRRATARADANEHNWRALEAKGEDARYRAAVDLGEPVLARLLEMLEMQTPYGIRCEEAVLQDLRASRARTGQGRQQRLDAVREGLSALKAGQIAISDVALSLEEVFGPAETDEAAHSRDRLRAGLLMLACTGSVSIGRAAQLVERLYVTGSLAEPEPEGALRALLDLAVRCVDSAQGRRLAHQYAYDVAEVLNLGGFDLAIQDQPT